MNFWSGALTHSIESPALVKEDGEIISYGCLNVLVDAVASFFTKSGTRQFGVLLFGNTVEGIITYLACLRAGHVPLLVPDKLPPQALDDLVRHYQPDWVISREEIGPLLPGTDLRCRHLNNPASLAFPLHEQLALLLSTSGTTGSAKLVRISYSALQANAESIATYFGLSTRDKTLTLLPPSYSFGLSIINSYLTAGACVVVKNVSVMTSDFGAAMRTHKITSISGVPYTYQMLQRTGFLNQEFPHLATMAQAGGRLDPRLVKLFGEYSQTRKCRFFVMYGQTEATARMSYLPSERILDKCGSIGIAIPFGKLSIDPVNSELVYSGPNVMMGYALQRSDLACGDVLAQVLRTGDIGHVDDDGYFFVTGRISRFVKLAGNRIGLDEVEGMLRQELVTSIAVGGRDDKMLIWIEDGSHEQAEKAKDLISHTYGLHCSLFKIKCLDRLPLLGTGKIDYQVLLADE